MARTNRLTFGVSTALSLVDPATPGGQQPDGQSGWTLVLSEEFGGSMTTIDAGAGLVRFRLGGPSWATWYPPDWPQFTSQVPGGAHTNTDQEGYYATSKVSVTGGELILKCDLQTTVSGLDYTAGMISSYPFFDYLYGYTEARIKITTASVTGHWPAWWASASAFNDWPPEIDYWEYFGNGTQYDNNTFMDPPGTSFHSTTNATQTTYHTYGCEWDSTSVTWFRDGTQTNTIGSTGTPQNDLYLILNNGARTPNSPSFSANDITVDYVRVWQ